VNRTRQDTNLINLIERYGDDEKCRAFLEKLRWPDGVRCLRCGSAKVSRVSTKVGTRQNRKVKNPERSRNQFDCDSCRHQFSVTAGTVFHDTHLPLWKWFLATYLMCESKKGMSANQLKRTLGIGSYKTAWYLCHRVRSAMTDDWPARLTGVVEVDETWVGGKRRHVGKEHALDNKALIIGALQRGGSVRLMFEKRGHRMTQTFAKDFLTECVDDSAEAIYTDENHAYHLVGDEDTRHESVNHNLEEWVRGDVTTNGIESAWSLLKRSIVGSYHQLSEKHLPAYLDEFAFRFNNRENPYLFRDTLLKLIEGDALPYATLTAAQ
jgi:transposase-like protein